MLSGHIAFTVFGRRVVIYGFNAMHVAVNIRTKKLGYICFHPPMKCFGEWWEWYFYISPNATPWGSTFAIGPGVSEVDKIESKLRRKKYGHNFNTNGLDYNDYHFWDSVSHCYHI